MIKLTYGYEICCDICGKRSAMSGYHPIQIEDIKKWKNEWQFNDNQVLCPWCKENANILKDLNIKQKLCL